MRSLAIVLCFPFLNADLVAQGRAACAPLDSTPVIDWHREWDEVSSDSIHKLATTPVVPASGIIEVRGWPGGTPGADPAKVHHSYKLSAFLLTQGGPDLNWEGMVRFGPPSEGLVESYAGNDYLQRGPLLQGMLWGSRLVGALRTDTDSIALEGIINPEGQLEFGTGFYTADGAWFTAIEWNEAGLRGWWYPPGAVIPDYLGYFCAYRL